MICKNCGAYNPEGSEVCSSCGANLKEQSENKNYSYIKKIDAGIPMRWYKFLVLFSLPMSAISNIISGIESIFYPSNETSDLSIIADIPKAVLDKLNVFMGLSAIIIAIFVIYTLGRMIRFKSNSLQCLISVYISNALVNTVYAILMLALVGVENGVLFLSIPISSIGTAVFMSIVNTIYFKKRAFLFKNQ